MNASARRSQGSANQLNNNAEESNLEFLDDSIFDDEVGEILPMFVLCVFLLCKKVLIVHRGSYSAHPLMKMKKLHFQGHTLRIDKIFLPKDKIFPKTLIRQKKAYF